MGLRNLNRAMLFNDRNVEALLRQREAATESGKASEAAKAEDMRIDSDDIHNHYHQQKEGMSSLAKLAAVALAATGVGIPASIAAWHLPEIMGVAKNAAAPAAEPAKSGGPSVNIGGKEYELSLEPE